MVSKTNEVMREREDLFAKACVIHIQCMVKHQIKERY